MPATPRLGFRSAVVLAIGVSCSWKQVCSVDADKIAEFVATRVPRLCKGATCCVCGNRRAVFVATGV